MPTIDTTNSSTTLQDIKKYIRTEVFVHKQLSPRTVRTLIELATTAYEIKGVLNARRAAVDFVEGNIFTATNY